MDEGKKKWKEIFRVILWGIRGQRKIEHATEMETWWWYYTITMHKGDHDFRVNQIHNKCYIII